MGECTHDHDHADRGPAGYELVGGFDPGRSSPGTGPPQASGSVGDAPNQSQLRLAGPAADPGRLVVDRDARAELGRLSNVTAIRLGINLDPSFE